MAGFTIYRFVRYHLAFVRITIFLSQHLNKQLDQNINWMIYNKQMYKLLINCKEPKLITKSPLRIIKQGLMQKQDRVAVTENQLIKQKLLHICQTQGKTYLYKHYKRDEVLMIKQTNLNFLSSKLQIKTQILFISKVTKTIYLTFLKNIQQRQQHIQLVQLIENPSLRQNNLMDIIIYFKNSLICQELYHLLVEQLNLFVVYIKEVQVVSQQPHAQLEKDLSYIINQFKVQKQKEQISKDSKIYQQIYIQIPMCLCCLIKLQYNISGLSQKLATTKSLISSQILCQTCLSVERDKHQIKCKDCSTSEDLWICMVCSDIGCGRYKNADAFKHFLNTGHIITMDLSTQRIWNYISDAFSHRIVPLQKQEITLKFPDYSTNKNSPKYQQSLQRAFWQYCSLVSEQLQRQRVFYQKQIAEQQDNYQKESVLTQKKLLSIEKQIDIKSLQVKKIAKKNKKLQKRLTQLRQKCKEDRQLLAGYQNYLKGDHRVCNLQQIEKQSPKIQQKLKILQNLEHQIQNTLMKLSQ